MALLAAFFDESDRSDGSAPLCVGGYIFRAADYERFKKRWHREVLRLPGRRQLRHLHMTDLCAGRGEYEGLSIPERMKILDRAVTVISGSFHKAVGIHFLQAEFEKVAPANWPENKGSIYTLACHMAVQCTAYWLNADRCHLDVLYVFERGRKLPRPVHSS